MKTMSYRYDRQKKKKRGVFLVSTIILIIVLCTPALPFTIDATEGLFSSAFKNRNNTKESASNFALSLLGYDELAQQIQNLEEENERLRVDVLRTQYLARERELGATALESNRARFSVLENNASTDDRLIADAGVVDGIRETAYVYYAGFLIGSVSQADDVSSEITLLSQPEQETSAILFPAGENVLLEGRGNGNFFIALPRGIEVAIGDQVFAYDQGRSIIALVRDVQFDPRDPFQSVYLSYPENTSKFNNIEIEKTPAL